VPALANMGTFCVILVIGPKKPLCSTKKRSNVLAY